MTGISKPGNTREDPGVWLKGNTANGHGPHDTSFAYADLASLSKDMRGRPRAKGLLRWPAKKLPKNVS